MNNEIHEASLRLKIGLELTRWTCKLNNAHAWFMAKPELNELIIVFKHSESYCVNNDFEYTPRKSINKNSLKDITEYVKNK